MARKLLLCKNIRVFVIKSVSVNLLCYPVAGITPNIEHLKCSPKPAVTCWLLEDIPVLLVTLWVIRMEPSSPLLKETKTRGPGLIAPVTSTRDTAPGFGTTLARTRFPTHRTTAQHAALHGISCLSADPDVWTAKCCIFAWVWSWSSKSRWLCRRAIFLTRGPLFRIRWQL